MEYRRKCLFRNSNSTISKEPTAQESLWAYVTVKGEKKTTGRYRIRITKFESAEMVALGMVEEGEIPEGLGFAVQGMLEAWNQDRGWLPVLDWVGDPDLPLVAIENELNKQYEAFITGEAIESDYSFDYKPPKSPKKRKTAKAPIPTPPAGDDGFDWI